MESEANEPPLEEQAVKLKRYVELLHKSWLDIKAELIPISDRLRMATSTRDPRAHSRAYQDLRRIVTNVLKKIPEKPPVFPLFEKPKVVARTVERMRRGDAPIPIINALGSIFMGCFMCDEWTDITPLFAEGKFDRIYSCPKGHGITFASVVNAQQTQQEAGK